MSSADDHVFRELYNAATNDLACLPLVGWSTLRMTGRDRATFLHNMCTSDIRGLAVGGQCEAFLTDVKGKIVGHALVLAGEDVLLLVGVPGQAARLVTHLDRYIIREDVQLADASANVAWSLVVGPRADNVTADLRAGSIIAACNWIWPGGYWVGRFAEAGVVAEMGGAKPSATADLRHAGGDAVLGALRVESGWPLFGVDFDEVNLPQEVGRDATAINFRKGCYLGQETIARIDALGHVNKRLATVAFDGADVPAIGAELTADGKSVGVVTSACWSPKLARPLAIAMVRRGSNEPGARLECAGQVAEVVATPAVTHQSSRPPA